MHIEDLCEALGDYQISLALSKLNPDPRLGKLEAQWAEALLLRKLEAAGLAGLIDFTPRKTEV